MSISNYQLSLETLFWHSGLRQQGMNAPSPQEPYGEPRKIIVTKEMVRSLGGPPPQGRQFWGSVPQAELPLRLLCPIWVKQQCTQA